MYIVAYAVCVIIFNNFEARDITIIVTIFIKTKMLENMCLPLVEKSPTILNNIVETFNEVKKKKKNIHLLLILKTFHK